MLDSLYKTGTESLIDDPERKRNFNFSPVETNLENMEMIVKQLNTYISKSDVLNVNRLLEILSSQPKSFFTLEIVQYYQLFELMRFISNNPDQSVQFHVVIVLLTILNHETIEYSLGFGILDFLIGLIRPGNQSLGFPAIQCLSKIAEYDADSHRQVVFKLSGLFDFSIFDCEKSKDNSEIEISCIKNSYGYQRLQYVSQPSIDPENDIFFTQKDPMQQTESYNQLDNYFTYVENGKQLICNPSLYLLISLLKFPLPDSFVAYCFKQFIKIIQISTEDTLEIVLNGLCTLVDKQSNWSAEFQASNPGVWIGTLFENYKSIKINKQLMLLLLKIIEKGEIIAGMPFSLLLQRLQFKNSTLAKYSASIIDKMILHDQKVISPLIEANLFPITNAVYPNANFAAKNQIVSYLARIAQLGNSDHKLKMLEERMFLAFTSTLSYDTEENHLVVRLFAALIELFDLAKRLSSLENYISLIDPDDLQLIRDIYQEHDNICLAKTANTFFSKFFDGQNENDDDYDDIDESPLFKF